MRRSPKAMAFITRWDGVSVRPQSELGGTAADFLRPRPCISAGSLLTTARAQISLRMWEDHDYLRIQREAETGDRVPRKQTPFQ
jgi:hypothetical protein